MKVEGENVIKNELIPFYCTTHNFFAKITILGVITWTRD